MTKLKLALAALVAAAALDLVVGTTAQGGQGNGGVFYPPLMIQDESSNLARATRALNFTGSGVTCTNSSGTITCAISSGGGGGNFAEVSISMTGGAGVYSTVVTGQTWVTGTSKILCTPFGTTADSLTSEQVAAAMLAASVSDLVAGTGFTMWVNNPFGSHGTHRFHCTGA